MNDCVVRLWHRVASRHVRRLPPLPGRAAPEAALRHPAVLVHGIWDTERTMQPMRAWLAAHGIEAFTMSLTPNDGSAKLEDLAAQVRDYIDRTFPPERKIDLIGFSMGGLVCRYYVQRLGGAARVARFICISAPNHGSRLAYLSRKAGCRQMRPGSAFLRELNGDLSALEGVRFTSLWTPLDLTILPARSSRLRLGAEIRRWVVAHPLMVLCCGPLRAVAEVLLTPPGQT